MSLHAFGAHSGRNAKAHERRTDAVDVHQDVPSTPDHKACVERIRHLRDENELLRKSADEFAALAERLQRALVRERARGGRAGTNGHGATSDGNRILTISMQIEAEYRSIQNLRLTRWQAARLWDLDQRECDEAIAALVRSRVLRETPGGFVRREK